VIPLSSRVPERASGPSQSRVDDGSGLQYVLRKIDRGLGFSCQGEYIGGRAASRGGPGRSQEVDQGGLTPWWHGLGLGRAALGCGWPLAPLRRYENISYVAFLKHKNSRK
jgi:hypothetical protein